MKIGITGHSKGLGEAIYNKLDKIYEVIGFSRTNGYDIQSPNKIIEKLENCIIGDLLVLFQTLV